MPCAAYSRLRTRSIWMRSIGTFRPRPASAAPSSSYDSSQQPPHHSDQSLCCTARTARRQRSSRRDTCSGTRGWYCWLWESMRGTTAGAGRGTNTPKLSSQRGKAQQVIWLSRRPQRRGHNSLTLPMFRNTYHTPILSHTCHSVCVLTLTLTLFPPYVNRQLTLPPSLVFLICQQGSTPSFPVLVRYRVGPDARSRLDAHSAGDFFSHSPILHISQTPSSLYLTGTFFELCSLSTRAAWVPPGLVSAGCTRGCGRRQTRASPRHVRRSGCRWRQP